MAPGTPAFQIAAIAAVVALKLAAALWIVPASDIVRDGTYNVNEMPDNYPNIAINWMNGDGYRVRPETTETMIRPPVNILLLAGVFTVFGESLAAVQVVNVLLTLAGGLLLFRLVRRRVGEVAGWLAAAIYVLHPGILLAETRGGVEVPITFLMVLFVVLLDRAFASRRAFDFGIAGLALGVTALTKSTPAIVAPFLMLYALAQPREQRLALCRGVVVLWIAFGVVLAPWVVRNYQISGALVPSMTIKGAAAYQGLYLARNGLGGGEFFEALTTAAEEQKEIARQRGLVFWYGDMLPIFYTPQDEVEFDAYLYERVIAEYRREPWLFVENVFDNAWRFWLQGKTGKATVLNATLTLPLLAVALVGVVLGFRRRLGFELVVLFALLYYAAHLPLVAFAKYHVPLIPFLALFASVALWEPLAAALERAGWRVAAPHGR